MFCDATTFHIVAVGRTDGGVPSSANAWPSFIRSWVSWAGYPVILACDRGLHNYGAFSKGLAMNGVYQRVAGLEAAEHIGRGERHGGIFKNKHERDCKRPPGHGEEADEDGRGSVRQRQN